MGPNQTYKLLHSKGNHKKIIIIMKRQPMKWEKIFANDMTDIYTNSSYNATTKNQTTQSKNGQKTLIDISPKKTYRWPIGT